MNNDLDQFSEERLKELAEMCESKALGFPASHAESAALARIALAAKQAKPEYHIVRLELNDAWGKETVLNAYESQLDASKCKDDHGGVIIPLYTTPPANSPAIPDSWKLVPIEPTQEMVNACFEATSAGGIQKGYRAMLAAAPKPESE